MALDSTMNFDMPQGPGGGSAAPGGRLEGTQRDVFPKPNQNGYDETGANRVPSVSKPETPAQVDSVFYDRCTDGASPGSLDSTLNDVLQISYGSK